MALFLRLSLVLGMPSDWVAGCLAAPENGSPTSPLHQHWCLSGPTRSWSRHNDSVFSCAGLQEAMARCEQGDCPILQHAAITELEWSARSKVQRKMAALHLTGVQQRTQRFVSTLSVQ